MLHSEQVALDERNHTKKPYVREASEVEVDFTLILTQ